MLLKLIELVIKFFFSHCIWWTVLIIIVYEAIFNKWNYFSERNLKFYRGLPFFGMMGEFLFSNRHTVEILKDIYNRFPNEQVIGIYDNGSKPVYMIRDPNIVKKITVTDFEHFTDHRFSIDETAAPIFGKTMFYMRAPKWRNMRLIFSSAFTGSQLRLMFGLMNEYNQKYIQNLRKLVKDNGNGIIELTDLFTRYATDIIGTCAFGVEVDSMKHKNNEFYKAGKYLTYSSVSRSLKLWGYMNFPSILKFFNVSVIDHKHKSYFRDLVLGGMKFREDHSIVRHDMINLLMMARKGLLKADETVDTPGDKELAAVCQELKDHQFKLDDDDYVAQCVTFFITGFDSIVVLLTFMAHELAINQDVQDRLYDEIKTIEKILSKNVLTYDILNKMKYMDMVVSETLRKWNPTISGDRLVTKDYNLRLIDGQKIHLNSGDNIMIPTICFHMDKKYFTDPERFDPERFNSENISKIIPGSYLPFGVGPRNCVGSRFALMKVKALFFYILSNFKLERCSKTKEPVKLKPKTFSIMSDGGSWIRFISRELD